MEITEFSFDNYREDVKKQNEGTPIYIDDAVFFVKRWGTTESQKVLRDLKRELFGPLHKSTGDDDSLLLAHWLAEYAVSGWDNVNTPDGPLKYSQKVARKVFLNPELYLSLNQLLFVECCKFENYLTDTAEEDIDAIKKP